MTIREEMVNGFGIIHGGIAFSLADSAFAFACNNRNTLSVALDTSINFIKPVHVGDILTAVATEIHNGQSTGLYQVEIRNQKDHVVALFKGCLLYTSLSAFPPQPPDHFLFQAWLSVSGQRHGSSAGQKNGPRLFPAREGNRLHCL